jgi:hypothetical protein
MKIYVASQAEYTRMASAFAPTATAKQDPAAADDNVVRCANFLLPGGELVMIMAISDLLHGDACISFGSMAELVQFLVDEPTRRRAIERLYVAEAAEAAQAADTAERN